MLNTARVRLNDAIQSISGDILTDTAAFALTSINAAWRRLQEYAADLGVAALNRETIFTGVIATTLSDVGSQAWINWVGYFNGGGFQAAPVFPQDMIMPLELQERITGSAVNYTPMDRLFNGIPTVPKQTLNRVWEWRQESIYFPGATGSTDIRMRYAGFLPDFVAPGTLPFASQNVQLMRTLNPFAWFICSEVAKARGDLDAGAFDQSAFTAMDMVFKREYRQEKNLYNAAELGKMPDQYSATGGPAGPRGQQKV